mgnify:CR=1 FL=1
MSKKPRRNHKHSNHTPHRRMSAGAFRSTGAKCLDRGEHRWKVLKVSGWTHIEAEFVCADCNIRTTMHDEVRA